MKEYTIKELSQLIDSMKKLSIIAKQDMMISIERDDQEGYAMSVNAYDWIKYNLDIFTELHKHKLRQFRKPIEDSEYGF